MYRTGDSVITLRPTRSQLSERGLVFLCNLFDSASLEVLILEALQILEKQVTLDKIQAEIERRRKNSLATLEADPISFLLHFANRTTQEDAKLSIDTAIAFDKAKGQFRHGLDAQIFVQLSSSFQLGYSTSLAREAIERLFTYAGAPDLLELFRAKATKSDTALDPPNGERLKVAVGALKLKKKARIYLICEGEDQVKAAVAVSKTELLYEFVIRAIAPCDEQIVKNAASLTKAGAHRVVFSMEEALEDLVPKREYSGGVEEPEGPFDDPEAE